MLVRCLYASRTIEQISPGLLDDILAQSRRNNPPRGITGLLCYTSRTFLQVLEGGRDEVCTLLNTIVRDARHQDVRLLTYEEITERRFARWTMGQVNIAGVNPALLLKYSERPELDPFITPGAATLSLLHELVASGSIVGRPGT
jgi:hypothetical protein